MRIANRQNLPELLVVAAEAVTRAPYPWPTVSVTEIIGPVRVAMLRRRHWDELEEDVVDRVPSLLGLGVHWILQHANRPDLAALTEETLEIERRGFTVRGHPDLYMGSVLSDWKVVGIASYFRGVKTEWAWQLNLYAHMLEENGFPVRGLEDIPILRDWMVSKARYDAGYPQAMVQRHPVAMKGRGVVEAYLDARLDAFERAYVLPDDALPECEAVEERWQSSPRWAVKREGAKVAVRHGNFGSPEEAQALITRLLAEEAAAPAGKRKRKQTPYIIEERPSVPNRCVKDPAGYCGVRDFCSWWRAHKAEYAAPGAATEKADDEFPF